MPLRALLTAFSLLFLIPVCYGQGEASIGLRRIVIDPGHGGKDPGAISPDGKIREKDITLSVSLKLGELIKKAYPHIEITYTRKTDISVALDQRTRIANKNKADLFISIHVNAAKSRSASGSETYVMGLERSKSNFEVTMLENSVIMLEGDDYSTKYEGFNPNDPESYIVFSLLQNAHLEQSLIMASLVQEQFAKGPIKVNRGIKQDLFLVLWKTSMPGILIELGFITNLNDLKVLNDKKNHDKFAQGIFKAFEGFKNQYEKGTENRKTTDTADKQNNAFDTSKIKNAVTNVTTGEHYRVQILAVSKILNKNAPDLKGKNDARYIKAGNLYKYTIGEFTTIDLAKKALEEIRKSFPQAFVIKVRNNTIVPINN